MRATLLLEKQMLYQLSYSRLRARVYRSLVGTTWVGNESHLTHGPQTGNSLVSSGESAGTGATAACPALPSTVSETAAT